MVNAIDINKKKTPNIDQILDVCILWGINETTFLLITRFSLLFHVLKCGANPRIFACIIEIR